MFCFFYAMLLILCRSAYFLAQKGRKQKKGNLLSEEILFYWGNNKKAVKTCHNEAFLFVFEKA